MPYTPPFPADPSEKMVYLNFPLIVCPSVFKSTVFVVTPRFLAPLGSLHLPPSPLAALRYKHSPNALLSWDLAVVEVRAGSTELKERLLQVRVWSEVWLAALCVCVVLLYSAHWSKAQVAYLLAVRA